jgi:hypothetical protein
VLREKQALAQHRARAFQRGLRHRNDSLRAMRRALPKNPRHIPKPRFVPRSVLGYELPAILRSAAAIICGNCSAAATRSPL